KIARMLELPDGIIAIPSFIIGLFISLWVIFKVLPKHNRNTFILSGVAGGVSGYLLWLEWLGPIVLP
ncbi:MAG: hypothetical protein ACPGTP_05365, partial [Bacteroidia bacterium]